MLHEIYQWTRQETDTSYQKIIFSDEETFDYGMPCTALPSVPMDLEPMGKNPRATRAIPRWNSTSLEKRGDMMLTLPTHEPRLTVLMDQLLIMLDLSSNAVYNLRKYMDDNNDAESKFMADTAINDLIDHGSNIIEDIEEIMQERNIDLNLPKKGR